MNLDVYMNLKSLLKAQKIVKSSKDCKKLKSLLKAQKYVKSSKSRSKLKILLKAQNLKSLLIAQILFKAQKLVKSSKTCQNFDGISKSR